MVLSHPKIECNDYQERTSINNNAKPAVALMESVSSLDDTMRIEDIGTVEKRANVCDCNDKHATVDSNPVTIP